MRRVNHVVNGVASSPTRPLAPARPSRPLTTVLEPARTIRLQIQRDAVKRSESVISRPRDAYEALRDVRGETMHGAESMSSFRRTVALVDHTGRTSPRIVTRLLAASLLATMQLSLTVPSLAQDGSERAADETGVRESELDADASAVSDIAADARSASDMDESQSDDDPFAFERDGRGEVDQGELSRWVPSFAIVSGILVEDASAQVMSSYQIFSATQALRPSANGSVSFTSPFVVGSLEIMTPRLLDGFAHPRVFAHVDVGGLFAVQKDVAKEGAPKDFVAPTDPPVNTDTAIDGQGSRTRAEPRPLVLTAGAGMAFSFDVGERRLRVKPSVEYLREEVRVSGLVHRAFVTDPNVPSYLFVELSASKDAVFHGFGPGLEIEADVARWNSLVVGVLASAQYYWIMSDQKVELSDSGQFGPLPASAQWQYKKGLHAVRAAVGMRFRWAPAD
jgi:hypothetical protein